MHLSLKFKATVLHEVGMFSFCTGRGEEGGGSSCPLHITPLYGNPTSTVILPLCFLLSLAAGPSLLRLCRSVTLMLEQGVGVELW